jgi:ABC-type Fe3+ transport system permease subunit
VDQRVERKLKSRAETFLWIAWLLCFALPFAKFLLLHIFFEPIVASALAAKMVLHSLIFTLLQAGLSTLVLAVAASVFALALCVLRLSASRWSRVLAVLGLLFFCLPGTALSLWVLSFFRSFGIVGQGLAAIVFAHVWANLIYVGRELSDDVGAWLAGPGLGECEAAASLGAPRSAVLMRIVRRGLWPRLLIWMRLVFVWSTMAFSTVLILGGGPKASSPEALMFFELQRGQISTLVYWSLGAQIFLALATRFVFANRWGLNESRDARQVSAWPSWLAPTWVRVSAAIVLATLLSPLLHFFVGQGLTVLAGLRAGDLTELVELGLLRALLHSIIVSLCVLALMHVWAELFLRSSTVLMRLFAVSTSVSMVAVAMSWDFVRLDQLAWLLIPLGASLVWLAPMSQQIESRLNDLSPDEREAAQSLGASDLSIRLKILRPRVRPIVGQIAILAAVASLGELVFSGFFSNDLLLLPQLTQRLAGQYRFSGSTWLVVLTGLWTLVLLNFLPKTQKQGVA